MRSSLGTLQLMMSGHRVESQTLTTPELSSKHSKNIFRIFRSTSHLEIMKGDKVCHYFFKCSECRFLSRFPVNVFAGPEITEPEFSIDWLYNNYADAIGKYLDLDANLKFRNSGNYAIRPQGTTGLKIISLNNNYGARY